MAIDTLAISDKLRAAGFTDEQAAAQVEALQEATEDGATERDMQRAIKRLESRIEALLAQMEVRILRYILFAMAGLSASLTAIFAVIVKFF